MQQTAGTSNIDTAKLCFEENLRLFGKTQQENHNLYKGLYKLAAALEQQQADIDQIKAMLADIHRRLP